ncbi:MAG: DUF4004 family protein [Clostridia bacterium]|nr:DUF4004 family protein [Clostridia bacterium]
MEQELISKKDLLLRYGISYGALYRWKRKGLIPEDWFIKKTTVTGQETFFPTKLICERVELIKSQKDELSLDELARNFSSESQKRAFMIVDTVYGEKIFYLNEIKSVIIDGGEGKKLDITEEIKNGRN